MGNILKKKEVFCMKNLKKVLAFCLAAAMLLTLAACSPKKTLADTVVGTWSADLDLSDKMTEYCVKELSGEGIPMDKLPDGTKIDFRMTCVLELKADGTYHLEIPQDALDASMARLSSSFTEVMRAVMETFFAQQAEAEGFSVDDLLAATGCSDLDELIEMAMGAPLGSLVDDLIAESFPEEMVPAEDGTFRADGNNLILVINGGAPTTVPYDEASDTLKLDVDIDTFGTVTLTFSRK